MIYYKAVRPDGTSFYDGTFRWLPDGWQSGDPVPADLVVEHPDYSPTDSCASRYLSAATVATDCTGMSWPCVLLEVEPVGSVRQPDPRGLPHKAVAPAWRVIRELPATDALGPQGVEVSALIDRCRHLTGDDLERLGAAGYTAGYTAGYATRATGRAAAWDAAGYTAGYATRVAARYATRDAAWDAAGYTAWDATRVAAEYATRDAVGALVVRDVISRKHYDALTLPWRDAIGPIHPDDTEADA